LLPTYRPYIYLPATAAIQGREERGAAPPKQQQQPENSEYSHQGIRVVLYGIFCDQKQVVVVVLT
jgi:hypothetical protein